MADARRTVDWRLIATWAVLLGLSFATRSYVIVADDARRGISTSLAYAFGLEGTSHLVVAALIPALYWLHRRRRMADSSRNLAIHVAAVVPFSIAHTLGMAALRFLWFTGMLGESFRFPITADRLIYEFAKDIVTYTMLNAGIMALTYIFARLPKNDVDAPVSAPPQSAPERFAVRKRGGTEVMVEVADIDWVEASGNYAILHVGGETFEIRSSLARLEGELDPRRFVRVHKSHIVNISRVTEVTPWVSGDWRIRLHDGAEINLSRRYRQRFEALAPVRT